MPRQNRAQPDGQILAHPTRGAFMGNRGILHDTNAHRHGQLTHRRWRHKAWVCCVLAFKNRQRQLMAPNRYTELFFFDEAVALAAGHRPCAECRRADHKAFLTAAEHTGKVADFDAKLHSARAVARTFRQNRAIQAAGDLPDATFILTDHGPTILIEDMGLPYAATGYTSPVKRPQGAHPVLTPAPTLIALKNGFLPHLRLPDEHS